MNDIDVLADFATTSPAGLRDKKLEDARAVILNLLKRGMGPEQILVRIVHSEHRDELFWVTFNYFQKANSIGVQGMIRFESAVLQSPKEWWRDGFKAQTLEDFFAKSKNLYGMIKAHRDIILNEKLPFYGALNADAYWRDRAVWFIKKTEYRRAWDVLVKAIRGTHDSAKYTEDQLRTDEVRRCLHASQKAIEDLTDQLFVELRKKREIPHLKNGGSFQIEALLKDPRELEYSRSLLNKFERPGGFTSFTTHPTLSRTGAQLVLLSTKFNGILNYNRRKKLEQKLLKNTLETSEN